MFSRLQKKFIDEYIKDMNPEGAALRAGYGEKSAKNKARQLLASSKIVQAIKNTIKEQARRLRVEKSYIIEKLLCIADFCLVIEDVFDKDGNPTGKKKFRDTSAGLKAVEMLVKYAGFDKRDFEKGDRAKISIVKNLDEERL